MGTRRNLVSQWKTYLSFCLYFNLPWLPSSAQTLSLFGQFLSTTFKAPSSIQNYISGVKTLHVLLDMSMECFTAIELKLALRGIARLKPNCPKQASPITPAILLAIHQVLDFQQVEHVVFWSLFLFAFFTFARKSNLVVSSPTVPQSLEGTSA